MKNRAFLKDKSAIFIGETLMLDICLDIALKKFKQISVISDDKTILKKHKKKFNFIKVDDLHNMSFDYLFSVFNEKVITREILKNIKILALNFHDGPLPKYAGLYSSTWAILNEEKIHGVCWHKIEESLDTGAIYQSVKFKINSYDKALNIDLKGVFMGIKLFRKLLTKLNNNENKGKKQNLTKRTYYGKKDFCKINNNGFLNFYKGSFENLKLFRALDFSAKKKNYISQPKILTNKGPLLINSLYIEKYILHKQYKAGTILNFKNNSISATCKDAILNCGIIYTKNKNFSKKFLPKLTKNICKKFRSFGLDINYKHKSNIINKKLIKYYNSKNYENKLFEIFEIVKKIFGRKINLPTNDKKKITFLENLGPGAHRSWDSLEHIKFLFSIEKRFKIKVNENNSDNFNNVGFVARYLIKTRSS